MKSHRTRLFQVFPKDNPVSQVATGFFLSSMQMNDSLHSCGILWRINATFKVQKFPVK